MDKKSIRELCAIIGWRKAILLVVLVLLCFVGQTAMVNAIGISPPKVYTSVSYFDPVPIKKSVRISRAVGDVGGLVLGVQMHALPPEMTLHETSAAVNMSVHRPLQ